MRCTWFTNFIYAFDNTLFLIILSNIIVISNSGYNLICFQTWQTFFRCNQTSRISSVSGLKGNVTEYLSPVNSKSFSKFCKYIKYKIFVNGLQN